MAEMLLPPPTTDTHPKTTTRKSSTFQASRRYVTYFDSKEKSSLIKELFSSLRRILTESLIDYTFKEVGKEIFVKISL